MKVIFDPDNILEGGGMNQEEREKYLELCRKLTSRDPSLDYPTITLEILSFILNDVIEKAVEIDKKYNINLTSIIQEIFLNIDLTDQNYIGCINIFCLQCILLFTHNALTYTDNVDGPMADFNKIFVKTSVEDFKVLTTGEWYKYDVMKENIRNNAPSHDLYFINDPYDVGYSLPRFTEYNTSVPEKYYIYLVLGTDYLTLDEIITSFLKRVVYCGLASDFTYADGNKLLPFEYVTHDIQHGKFNQRYCYGQWVVDFTAVEKYYNFCKATLDKKTLYSVKLVLFLLLHESVCSFFNDEMTADKVLDKGILRTQITNLAEPIKRFMNLNDLGQSIPIKYRENEETIRAYLGKSAEIYVDNYNAWKSTLPPLKGGRKSRRTRKRKARRSRSRK